MAYPSRRQARNPCLFIDLSLCNNSVAFSANSFPLLFLFFFFSFFFFANGETFSTDRTFSPLIVSNVPQLMRVTHLIVSVSRRMKREICVGWSTTGTLVCSVASLRGWRLFSSGSLSRPCVSKKVVSQ